MTTRQVIFCYETGEDDGLSAAGYAVVYDENGNEIGRGGFHTDGQGTFVLGGWPLSKQEAPFEGPFDWVEEDDPKA